MKKIISFFLIVVMSVVLANFASAETNYRIFGNTGFEYDAAGNVTMYYDANAEDYGEFLNFMGNEYSVKTITLKDVNYIGDYAFLASCDTLEEINICIDVYNIGYNIFGETHNVSVNYAGDSDCWNNLYKNNNDDYYGDVRFYSEGYASLNQLYASAYGDQLSVNLYFDFVASDCVAEIYVYNYDENGDEVIEATFLKDIYAGNESYDFSFDFECDGDYHFVRVTLFNNRTDKTQWGRVLTRDFFADNSPLVLNEMNIDTNNLKLSLSLKFAFLNTDCFAYIEIFDFDENNNTDLNTSYTYEISAGTSEVKYDLPFRFNNKYHRMKISFYEDAAFQKLIDTAIGDFSTWIIMNEYNLEFTDDDTFRIIWYSGWDSELRIPLEFSGYAVTEIGEEAFLNNTYISSVFFPKSITKIGNRAFLGCENLEKILYTGTEEDWEEIVVGENNEIFLNADVTFYYFKIEAFFSSNYGSDDHQVHMYFSGCTKDCVARIDLNNISKNEITTLYFDIPAGTTTKTVDVPLTDYDETFQIFGSVMSTDKTDYYVIPSQFVYFTPFSPDNVDYTEGDFSYSVRNGEAEITGYNRMNAKTVIEIPETLGGYPVTGLAGWSLCEVQAEEIIIGKNIKKIGYGALSYNFNLKNIVVDQQNHNFVFENGVLYNSDKTELVLYLLTNAAAHFDMPDSVEVIGAHSFEGHEYLKTIEVSDNVRKIERQAFAYSKIGGELVLPEGLESIGFEALVAEFSKIYIPKTVEEIAHDAMLCERGLKEINVAEENANYTSRDGVLFNKDMSKLLMYPSGKKMNTYVIPDGVKELGYVSMGMATINALYIPMSLKTVQEGGISNKTTLLLYEGSESEFIKIVGVSGAEQFMDIAYNTEKRGIMLENADANYCEEKLTVRVNVKYMLEDGAVIAGIYDEKDEMIDFKAVNLKTSDSEVEFIFDADEKYLDYTVKVMCWKNDGSLLPHTDVINLTVKRSIIVNYMMESEHPYTQNSFQDFSYPGECDSIEITFSEDTSVEWYNSVIWVVGENFYQNYTGDELAGATIRVPGNSIGIELSVYSPNSNGYYGYKIEKIKVNLK